MTDRCGLCNKLGQSADCAWCGYDEYADGYDGRLDGAPEELPALPLIPTTLSRGHRLRA